MSDFSPGSPDPVGFPREQRKRPYTASFLAVVIYIAAIVQLLAVVAAIVLMLRPGDAQQLFGQPASDWYWLVTAGLTLFLALVYFWMARGILRGDAQAWMLLNLIAILNIVFAIFQIPFGTGWASLFLNALILILNNVASVRNWFRVLG